MLRTVTVSVGLLLLVGCGSSANKGLLEGTIKYKGEPVNGATLMLYPAAGADANTTPISITVTQEGTFNAADVPAGEYKIVVRGAGAATDASKMMRGMPADKQGEAGQKFQQAYGGAKPTIAFPNKYKDYTTTDLKCTVGKGKQKVDLVLTD